MKRLLIVLALGAVMAFPAASGALASGGHGPPVYVKPTPSPKHKPTEVPPSTPTTIPTPQAPQPTPTGVTTSGTPTSAPTATAVPSSTSSVAPMPPISAAGGPSSTSSDTTPSGGPRLAAYCLYQPTTQQYETRLTTDVLRAINANLDTAHPAYVMPPEGVCSQPTPTPLPASTPIPPSGTTSTLPPLSTWLPTATIPVTTVPEMPAPPSEDFSPPSMPSSPPTEEETPEITVSDDMPPVQIP